MIPSQAIYDEKTGKTEIISMLPNEFVDNYEMIEDDVDQSAKNEIKIQQISDKTEDHLKKWRTALTTAINKAGLSPFALGITGLESINSSAESQQERNKVTLETRSRKLKIWKPFIEDVILKILEFNSWLQKNTDVKQEAFAQMDLDFNNLKVDVDFGDYIIEKISDKITTWGNAKQQGISSTKMAVSKIHNNDLSDEEIDEEVNRILYEHGMALDNPANLPNLTGKEEPEEDDDKDIDEDMKDKIDKNNPDIKKDDVNGSNK
jgi:hypothetical protein